MYIRIPIIGTAMAALVPDISIEYIAKHTTEKKYNFSYLLFKYKIIMLKHVIAIPI